MPDNTVHFNADGNLQQVLENLVRQVEALGHKVIKGTIAFNDLGNATNAVELKIKTATGITRTWTGEVDKLAKSFELAALNQSKFSAETTKTLNKSVQATTILAKLKKSFIPEISQLSPEKRFDVDVAEVRLADYLTKNKITLDFFNRASAAFGAGAITKDFKGDDLQKAIELIQAVQRFQSVTTSARASIFGGLENLPKIKDAASKLGKEINDIKPSGLKDLKAVADDTPKSLDRLSSMITKIGIGLDETKGKVDDFGISWNTVFRLYTIQLLHRALSATIREIKEGLSEAIKLQVAIAEVQTIDTGRSPFDTWLVGLRKLSDQFGTSLPDQTEAAYQALSNQVVNSASEFELLGTKINEFALTTKTSAANSIELLTGALNAYNLTLADTDRVFAQLFKTIELGRVRADEIANIYGRILVPANQLNISLEEVGATLTLMTIKGVKAGEAITFLRNIFQKLIRPTEEMKKFYREIGVASGEAAIAAYGFSGLMKLIEERTNGSSSELGELFGRIRAITGAMMFSGGNLNRYNEDLNSIRNSTEDYGKAIDIVLNNLGKRLQIEGQQIVNFFTVDLGNSLLTAVDKIPFLVENIDTLVKSLIGLGAVVAGGAIGILISKLTTLSMLGAIPWGPALIGMGATVATAAVVTLATETERLKKTLEEAGTAAEKLYHEKHRKEVQATVDLLQEYNRVVAVQVQNELQALAARDKVYQEAIAERSEAIKKLAKLTTNDLQYLDKKIGELSKTVKKQLSELISQREALNNKDKSQLAAIDDARFRAIDENDFVAQQTFVNRKLEQLEEDRAKAAQEGNVELYNKLTKEIEDLLNKLEQIEFARSKEYNTLVNLADIERRRTQEHEKQLKFEQEMKQLLDERIEAKEKEQLAIERYQQDLKDLTDAVRGFNADNIKNAKNTEELNKIIKDRTEAYDALQAALAKDPELNEIRLKNLDAQRAEEEKLILSVKKRLEIEEKQTKLQIAQKELVTAQAKLKEATETSQNLKSLAESIVAKIFTVITEGSNVLVKEGNQVVLNNSKEARPDVLLAGEQELKNLAEALNTFSRSPSLQSLLQLKDVFNTLLLKRDGYSNVGFLDQLRNLFSNSGLDYSGTKIDEILKNLDVSYKDFIDLLAKANNNANLIEQFKLRETELLTLIKNLQEEQGFRQTSLAGADPKILLDIAADVKKIANKTVPGFAAGGFVPGFGHGDTVHALLTPGEFVVNKRAAMRFRPQLIAMNQGYAQGGEVINVGGISVTVTGGPTSKSTVEEIAEGINRAIRTKRIRLRR